MEYKSFWKADLQNTLQYYPQVIYIDKGQGCNTDRSIGIFDYSITTRIPVITAVWHPNP